MYVTGKDMTEIKSEDTCRQSARSQAAVIEPFKRRLTYKPTENDADNVNRIECLIKGSLISARIRRSEADGHHNEHEEIVNGGLKACGGSAGDVVRENES
jgi:hypothetical protein